MHFPRPAKRIWPSIQQIWSSMPSLHLKMVLQVLSFGFQHCKNGFLSRLGNCMTCFLLPEPKSSSEASDQAHMHVPRPAKRIWQCWFQQIWSSMLSTTPKMQPPINCSSQNLVFKARPGMDNPSTAPTTAICAVRDIQREYVVLYI